MDKLEDLVPLKEAMEQVEVAMIRLALMHLSFSKIIVEELGDEKGKNLIVKSILEYGKRVGERTKKGHQGLPYYGVHERYVYNDIEYVDSRKTPRSEGEGWDLSLWKVYGCSIAKIFKEYGEEELGCLYCYVDAAKTMAADPNHKLVHTFCEACGDEYCAFDFVPTTEKERIDFSTKGDDWKLVDPILIKGIR